MPKLDDTSLPRVVRFELLEDFIQQDDLIQLPGRDEELFLLFHTFEAAARCSAAGRR